ncbi:MAG: NAD(P)/FAD-dependent oxidoreductase [Clostridia bacterium]|nr:NAD(P)/FAD-dependent oxidoreductase [Clostridia bacterium]
MSKGKIAVIGANQGGLVFAKFACDYGFDVTIYEACAKDKVSYNWTDDCEFRVFEELGFGMPPKNVWYRKKNWTFVPPRKEVEVPLHIPEKDLDLSCFRRPLNNWLEGYALKAGAKINYSTPVKEAIVEDGKVVGIKLNNGKKVKADLVVDIGGVDSQVRRRLPKKLGIQNEVSDEDKFYVRRTYFNIPKGTELPTATNKVYLKHLNELGISWCILGENKDEADVLIGRLGKLPDKVHDNALSDLKKDNPIIGDKVLNGGQLLAIPVRHPLPCLIADGYVILGDAACMTIPMLGSGMASSMRAGKILADVINKPKGGKRFSKANLYRYQYRFMTKIGCRHAGVDLMKNWLLDSPEGAVDFLFGKGVVGETVLRQGAEGRMVMMSPKELVLAGVRGATKPFLLIKLVLLIVNMYRAFFFVKLRMPKEYDKRDFKKWQKKYEKIYK